MAGKLLAFDEAVGLLQSGGVLVMGTDTLPGFHGRADLTEPVARILDLKGRPGGKPLVVLAGSADQAALVTGRLADRQSAYCRLCWPGPFSLILPAGADLIPEVRSGTGTVAVRVPAVPSLRDLILAVGFPLVSTSANLSGQAAISKFEEACRVFGKQVNGSWQPAENVSVEDGNKISGPSALIDATVWPPVELRPGPRSAPPAA
jgi:L-threonylcarbamoyladenylate synthase